MVNWKTFISIFVLFTTCEQNILFVFIFFIGGQYKSIWMIYSFVIMSYCFFFFFLTEKLKFQISKFFLKKKQLQFTYKTQKSHWKRQTWWMSSNDCYCHPCSPPTSLKMSNQFEKFTITNLIKKENFLWKKEREKTTSIHYLVFVLGQNEIWILIDCVSALLFVKYALFLFSMQWSYVRIQTHYPWIIQSIVL